MLQLVSTGAKTDHINQKLVSCVTSRRSSVICACRIIMAGRDIFLLFILKRLCQEVKIHPAAAFFLLSDCRFVTEANKDKSATNGGKTRDSMEHALRNINNIYKWVGPESDLHSPLKEEKKKLDVTVLLAQRITGGSSASQYWLSCCVDGVRHAWVTEAPCVLSFYCFCFVFCPVWARTATCWCYPASGRCRFSHSKQERQVQVMREAQRDGQVCVCQSCTFLQPKLWKPQGEQTPGRVSRRRQSRG